MEAELTPAAPVRRKLGRPRKHPIVPPKPTGRPRKYVRVIKPDVPEPKQTIEEAMPVPPAAHTETVLHNPPPREDPPSGYPKRIKMIRPYGYVTDDGMVLHWFQGQIVDDPATIASLVARHCVDFTVID